MQIVYYLFIVFALFSQVFNFSVVITQYNDFTNDSSYFGYYLTFQPSRSKESLLDITNFYIKTSESYSEFMIDYNKSCSITKTRMKCSVVLDHPGIENILIKTKTDISDQSSDIPIYSINTTEVDKSLIIDNTFRYKNEIPNIKFFNPQKGRESLLLEFDTYDDFLESNLKFDLTEFLNGRIENVTVNIVDNTSKKSIAKKSARFSKILSEYYKKPIYAVNFYNTSDDPFKDIRNESENVSLNIEWKAINMTANTEIITYSALTNSITEDKIDSMFTNNKPVTTILYGSRTQVFSTNHLKSVFLNSSINIINGLNNFNLNNIGIISFSTSGIFQFGFKRTFEQKLLLLEDLIDNVYSINNFNKLSVALHYLDKSIEANITSNKKEFNQLSTNLKSEILLNINDFLTYYNSTKITSNKEDIYSNRDAATSLALIISSFNKNSIWSIDFKAIDSNSWSDFIKTINENKLSQFDGDETSSLKNLTHIRNIFEVEFNSLNFSSGLYEPIQSNDSNQSFNSESYYPISNIKTKTVNSCIPNIISQKLFLETDETKESSNLLEIVLNQECQGFDKILSVQANIPLNIIDLEKISKYSSSSLEATIFDDFNGTPLNVRYPNKKTDSKGSTYTIEIPSTKLIIPIYNNKNLANSSKSQSLKDFTINVIFEVLCESSTNTETFTIPINIAKTTLENSFTQKLIDTIILSDLYNYELSKKSKNSIISTESLEWNKFLGIAYPLPVSSWSFKWTKEFILYISILSGALLLIIVSITMCIISGKNFKKIKSIKNIIISMNDKQEMINSEKEKENSNAISAGKVSGIKEINLNGSNNSVTQKVIIVSESENNSDINDETISNCTSIYSEENYYSYNDSSINSSDNYSDPTFEENYSNEMESSSYAYSSSVQSSGQFNIESVPDTKIEKMLPNNNIIQIINTDSIDSSGILSNEVDKENIHIKRKNIFGFSDSLDSQLTTNIGISTPYTETDNFN